MSLGPNRGLIGKDKARFERDLATPALCLDLDAFEMNLRTMADLAARHGKKVRPHAKAHKSSVIGRRQIEAGAVGLCCATVLEAETMAAAGIDGVLVTTPVGSGSAMARLVHARDKVNELLVAIDGDEVLDLLAAAARPERPIGVFIDIDVGVGRTGVTSPEDAVRLAKRVAALPQLRYRGIQAYYGHLQHVPAFAERHAKAAEQWKRLAVVVGALKGVGLAPEIVSGGGTGTHQIDLEHGPFTEIQPGSYLFMDKQYGAVELAPGAVPFKAALSVVGRVVSTAQPDRVIVDAGMKALSTDAGPAPIISGVPDGATHQFMGDEHSAIRMTPGNQRPRLGDLVGFIPPHCDPTLNLYDQLHVVRDGRLVDIWPIEARGH